jgi:hypothetical protein
VNLRELAEAARDGDSAEALEALHAACSPERILALLDVADAADVTPEFARPSSKSRWWREDGMAGAAIADKELRAALAHWHDLSR